MKINFQKKSPAASRTQLFYSPLIAQEGAKATKAKGAKKPIAHKPWVELDSISDGAVSKVVDHYGFALKRGERLDVPVLSGASQKKPCTIRLAALSDETFLSTAQHADEWRRVGGDCASAVRRLKVTSAAVLFETKSKQVERELLLFLEGLYLGSYEFTIYKGQKRKRAAEVSLTIVVGDALTPAKCRQILDRARVLSEAVCLGRDLVNTPPADLLPKDIVSHAKAIARGRGSRMACKVFSKTQLKRMGATGILAVGKGSDADPFLIHMTYRPKKRTRTTKKVVLIGKGVTFDSGGLSLKPGKSMEDMKVDMGGAAAVLCVAKALRSPVFQNLVEHEVHIVIPTCENMVNGSAYRPGDVLRAMNGKTIEVLNTDAEGRLILADALCYSERIKADVIIDLATLTGACMAALGSVFAGLFSDSAELVKSLEDCGDSATEFVWQLPLARQYRPLIESKTADIRNTGMDSPGATTAALFLKEFVPAGVQWAHLDIAGPAYVSRPCEFVPSGATGFGIRLLMDYLTQK